MYRFPTAQYPWGRTLGQDAEAAAAPVVTQYKGVPGFVETAAVLGVSAAAAWVGIRAGMKEKGLPPTSRPRGSARTKCPARRSSEAT